MQIHRIIVPKEGFQLYFYSTDAIFEQNSSIKRNTARFQGESLTEPRISPLFIAEKSDFIGLYKCMTALNYV